MIHLHLSIFSKVAVKLLAQLGHDGCCPGDRAYHLCRLSVIIMKKQVGEGVYNPKGGLVFYAKPASKAISQQGTQPCK